MKPNPTEYVEPMTVDRLLDEALGFFEAFRRFGFPPEEIFLGLDEEKVFLVLSSQGKQFFATCGAYAGDQESLHQRWREKAAWWNATATEEQRSELWNRSFARNHAIQLLTGLMRQGLVLPLSLKRVLA